MNGLRPTDPDTIERAAREGRDDPTVFQEALPAAAVWDYLREYREHLLAIAGADPDWSLDDWFDLPAAVRAAVTRELLVQQGGLLQRRRSGG